MLEKVLKNMLEPRTAKIETTQDLRTKCLNQPYCAHLLKVGKTVDGSTKNAIQPKMDIASMDSANLVYVKNLEEYLPVLVPGKTRFVVFQKVSGSLDPKDTCMVTSMATIDGSGVSYGQMSNLMADVLSGTKAMKKLAILPMVKTRTKKLEYTLWHVRASQSHRIRYKVWCMYPLQQNIPTRRRLYGFPIQSLTGRNQ